MDRRVALTLIALAVLFVAVFGWNWLRGSVERTALEKTGRELVIGGDLAIEFGWPHPRIHAGTVTFANPAWAREKQMVAAEAFEVSICRNSCGETSCFPRSASGAP